MEPSKKHIGAQLKLISNKFTRELDRRVAQAARPLTSSHGHFIMFIASHPDGVFLRDIEEAFGIRRSTASDIVSLMERNGLVTRSAVSFDARLKKIELTPKGFELNESIRDIIFDTEGELAALFTPEEFSDLCEYLARIDAAF